MPRPDLFYFSAEPIMFILRLAYFGPSSFYALKVDIFFSRACILGGSSKLSTSDDDSSEESLIPYCLLSSFSSYFFFLSLIAEVLSTWSKASMITARMTLSRKNDPTTTNRILKPIAIHAWEESQRLYIRSVQPSRVIIWKMVIRARKMLSNVVMP